MADEADMTQARIEAEDAMRAKQAPAPALPPFTGQCLYCGEATAKHFCSTDCRKDWDREIKIRRAQGLA
jgi:hypothetical protein